jgi:hypothetical protein
VSNRVFRSRTKDELKAALQLLIDCKALLHVPVDEENDADCIVADGIYELDDLRTKFADLRTAALEMLEEICGRPGCEHTDHARWRAAVEPRT